MSAPDPSASTLPGADGRLLLDSAARLLDERVAAIRSGSAPLHVLLELERAARAIRSLGMELGRLHEPGGCSAPRAAACALRGPPVLQRAKRQR